MQNALLATHTNISSLGTRICLSPKAPESIPGAGAYIMEVMISVGVAEYVLRSLCLLQDCGGERSQEVGPVFTNLLGMIGGLLRSENGSSAWPWPKSLRKEAVCEAQY